MNAQLPDFKIVTDDDGNKDVELLETTHQLKMDYVPISCTFGKIGKHIIVDPVLKEEGIQDARLTFAFRDDGKVCATQKGENGTFTIDEIKKCIDIASERTKEIRSQLDKISDAKAYPWSEET